MGRFGERLTGPRFYESSYDYPGKINFRFHSHVQLPISGYQWRTVVFFDGTAVDSAQNKHIITNGIVNLVN